MINCLFQKKLSSAPSRDEFCQLLVELAAHEPLQWVLKIGCVYDGEGVDALVEGLMHNVARPILFCLESSQQHVLKAADRYAYVPFVHCLHISPCGIDQIMQQHAIDRFDLAVLGGSKSTGGDELNEVHGAGWIVLEGIKSDENHRNYQRLSVDPVYHLFAENWHLRNGYAVFRHLQTPLPVHFFTIVLNGMPFISHHIDVFRHLPFRWHWHIVEGVAELVGDTAWSRVAGGHIPASFHEDGKSIDGTSTYLEALKALYPENISIYRKPHGQFWNGKLEMVNAPLQAIREPCLLWEIDADECWTHRQLCDGWRLFHDHPDKTAAYYWCHFFVGPDLVVSSRNCYSQVANQEWLRTWRYTPGCVWEAHEPPRLVTGCGQPVESESFSNDVTEAHGLVFQHFAYVAAEQVRFKEKYYGYSQATFHWLQLQKEQNFPQLLGAFLPWVHDGTMVDRSEVRGIIPLPIQPILPAAFQQSSIVVIDGVFFQYYVTGIARVWQSLLEMWQGTRFASKVIILDRCRTAPRIDGYQYLDLPLHQEGTLETEQKMLQEVCDRLGAGLFVSTWHTSPSTTRSLLMLHDMIPELLLGNQCQHEPRWREKIAAIAQASGYVTVSQSTARDLVRFYPEVAAKPIHIIHNGVSRHFCPVMNEQIAAFRARHLLDLPYYLYVGPRGWYKNFQLLLEAFALLPNGSSYCIVSPHGDTLEAEFVTHAAAHSVRLIGRLSEEELVAAYCGAVALVYPSRHEGFGLPLLEAMACGCPVIAGNTPALAEVCGDAALLVSPDDAPGLAHAMLAVQSQEHRMAFVRRGLARAAEFSWQRSASQLLRAICGMLGMQMGLDNLCLEQHQYDDDTRV